MKASVRYVWRNKKGNTQNVYVEIEGAYDQVQRVLKVLNELGWERKY